MFVLGLDCGVCLRGVYWWWVCGLVLVLLLRVLRLVWCWILFVGFGFGFLGVHCGFVCAGGLAAVLVGFDIG